MKLFICLECQDVVRLVAKKRKCQCGKCWGKYQDDIFAVYSGPAIPIGFDNSSLAQAIANQPEDGLGVRFSAFVIPKECGTYQKVKKRKPRKKK